MKKSIFAIAVMVAGVQLPVLAQLSLKPITLPGINLVNSLRLAPINYFVVAPTRATTTRTDAGCTSTCPMILPLTALELQGNRLNDRQVALNWKTRHETDSRGFDIERSLGDATHFKLVGSIPSNTGASVEKRYANTDVNPYAGVSFYRIKQIDLSGNFAYSNTISVKGYDTKESLWLWPNPASSAAQLTCFTAVGSLATVSLLTAHGQTVYQTPWALTAGSNTLRLPVTTLPPGTYHVQITWPDGHRSQMKLAKE